MKRQPRQFNLIGLSIWAFILILSTSVPSVALANGTSPTNYAPQRTNKVVLINFDATPNGNAVQLTWSTRREQNTENFQVIRGTTSNFSDATLVADSSVSTQGEDGGEYEFIDTSADVTIRYLYWLRETQSDDQIQIYGPTASLISSSAPAAISLADFDATFQADGSTVQLKWQTSSEINTQGFWILRSTTGQREDAVRVNSGMVVSNGSQGGHYEYLDTSILDDFDYTYWIEEQEQDGTTHVYSPATAESEGIPNFAIEVQGTFEAPYRVLLPIVML